MSERDLKSNDTSILRGNNASVIENGVSTQASTYSLISGFKITGGESQSGGGVFNDGSKNNNAISIIIIDNCTISGNSALHNGGGIYNLKGGVVMQKSKVCNNVAEVGGGIVNELNSSFTCTNSAIFNNSATIDGGGVVSKQSLCVLLNTTISGNHADVLGGGIFSDVYNSPNPAVATIYCIVWGNQAGTSGNDLYNTNSHVFISNSIFPVGATDFVNIDGASLNVDTTNIRSEDPLFVDAAAGNFRLLTGSPAINKGMTMDELTAMLSQGNGGFPMDFSVDVEGNPRMFGDTIDLGAYENQDPVVLPVRVKQFTGSLENGVATLKWESGVEVNLIGYELEKSIDGQTFNKIGATTAKGSNLLYTYRLPQTESTAYYRLLARSINGENQYDNTVVTLSNKTTNEQVLIFPNPARDYINVQVAAPADLKIYDAAGRLIKTKAFSPVYKL